MSYFKKYKFDKSQFKLGMRTFKTGIAVFLVLLIFGFFGWKGLQIGALTAVFSLRESFDESVHFGTSRILGNSIGGLYALVFFLLNTFFHEAFWVTLVVVPICTMLTIMTNVAMNNKAGVIGGVAAMLIITLSIPSGETISYVFVRVSETFMGVFVAIIVNYDIDRIRLFLEKKDKRQLIMLHFITLSIDVCLFLDYNRQKEGNCK
ncbi:membrane protein [Streptococcus pneumoniae]|nr:membrane protein [Streptococcus pneumoniae]